MARSWGWRGALESQPARTGQAKSHPTTSISDKGYSQKEKRKRKKKKKEKFLRTFPPSLAVGGVGGWCLQPDSPPRQCRGADWRAGPRAGERAWGRGDSAPAGAARAGSGLISNRGLDCSWTVTLPPPARRPPPSPGPGAAPGTHLCAAGLSGSP